MNNLIAIIISIIGLVSTFRDKKYKGAEYWLNPLIFFISLFLLSFTIYTMAPSKDKNITLFVFGAIFLIVGTILKNKKDVPVWMFLSYFIESVILIGGGCINLLF